MSIRDEFFKTEDPQKMLDLYKKLPKKELDKEVAKHFNDVARKTGNGETRENHTDPRVAFKRR